MGICGSKSTIKRERDRLLAGEYTDAFDALRAAAMEPVRFTIIRASVVSRDQVVECLRARRVSEEVC